MDEVPTRNIVEAHAKAVVEGDMDTAAADFAPELRNDISELAQQLPEPVADADVRRLEMEDDHANVEILYSNDEQSLIIRTRWEEIDGRPMIVEAKPLDE